MNAIKTIVFDFGNVIGFFDHRLTLDRLVPHSPMSAAEMFERIYNGALEDDFESGKLRGSEFLAKFRELCALRCDERFLQSAFADIFRPNPEVCRLLPMLKSRYRLVLGSNTNEVHASHFRGQFAEHLAHFAALGLSYELGARKPFAAFFEGCHRLAQCERCECLFIDDLLSNVEGAHRFGWQTIQYRSGNGLANDLRKIGIAI